MQVPSFLLRFWVSAHGLRPGGQLLRGDRESV